MAVVNGAEPAQVNQSTMAVVNQEGSSTFSQSQYAAFGHGTMTSGIVHLVAPTAQIMPLKAFHADGTGNLSDVLCAIYYATQNGANVLSMSFDFTSYSPELARAMGYATDNGLIGVASVGNDGEQVVVYPAGRASLPEPPQTPSFRRGGGGGGPRRDGPRRDGPRRDGPRRDGPRRDGPHSRSARP